MNTKVVTIKEDHIDEEAIQEAGQILKNGGLVAFPTETVYGLGGDALNAESSAKIYAAKGRPSDNPLIVHIADMDALPLIAAEIPESAYLLADDSPPGICDTGKDDAGDRKCRCRPDDTGCIL